jgi:hypothetical protein
VIASAIVAGTLMAGAAAYATAGAVTNGRGDNVGRLEATTPRPVDTTAADPAAVTSTAIPAPADDDRGDHREPGRERHERDDDDD